jgi:hypothetical protein
VFTMGHLYGARAVRAAALSASAGHANAASK